MQVSRWNSAEVGISCVPLQQQDSPRCSPQSLTSPGCQWLPSSAAPALYDNTGIKQGSGYAMIPHRIKVSNGPSHPGAQPRFQSFGVQFLGLGYYTEQNMDGIPSFVHCSLLRNGNHTLHQKSWGGPSNFFWEGRSGPPPDPPVVAPLLRLLGFHLWFVAKNAEYSYWTARQHSSSNYTIQLSSYTWHYQLHYNSNLWSPYVIRRPYILSCCFFFFMVALCNRDTIYIFMLFLLLLFFPRLISAAADWMSTILRHMVWS